MRLRDIAARLAVTERSAFGIITDLVEAGYVVKEKNGRRNRYHIQAHLSRYDRTPNPARLDGVAVRETPGTDCPVLSGTPAGRVNPSAGEPCRRRYVLSSADRPSGGGGSMPARQVVVARGRFSLGQWSARAVPSGAGAVVEVGGEGGVAASFHLPAQRRVG